MKNLLFTALLAVIVSPLAEASAFRHTLKKVLTGAAAMGAGATVYVGYNVHNLTNVADSIDNLLIAVEARNLEDARRCASCLKTATAWDGKDFINRGDYKYEWLSPLCKAIEDRNVAMVKLLLEYGANPKKDCNGKYRSGGSGSQSFHVSWNLARKNSSEEAFAIHKLLLESNKELNQEFIEQCMTNLRAEAAEYNRGWFGGIFSSEEKKEPRERPYRS